MDMSRSIPVDMMDARQLRTHHALSEALLSLLNEKPFDELTVRAIAARAGIGYATFFRHYATRDALLSDVASTEIARLMQVAMPMLATTPGYASAQALCRYVEEHRNLWSALLTGSAAGVVRAEFIRQSLTAARKRARANDRYPPDLAALHASGGTIDILGWWLSQENPLPADEIAAIIEGLIVAPLLARPED